MYLLARTMLGLAWMTHRSAARLTLLLAWVVLAAGCAAFSGPVPFHFMEGPQTLPRGELRLDLGGGGGGGRLGGLGSGGGGAGRARVSMGRAGEIGVSTYVLGNGSGMYTGAKADYKVSLAPWAALLAGAGGGWTADHAFAGGDLGLVVGGSGRVVRPYFGLRGGLSVPVGAESHEGATTVHVNLAGGARARITSRFYYVLELGLGGLFAKQAGGEVDLGCAAYVAPGISVEL